MQTMKCKYHYHRHLRRMGSRC